MAKSIKAKTYGSQLISLLLIVSVVSIMWFGYNYAKGKYSLSPQEQQESLMVDEHGHSDSEVHMTDEAGQ